MAGMILSQFQYMSIQNVSLWFVFVMKDKCLLISLLIFERNIFGNAEFSLLFLIGTLIVFKIQFTRKQGSQYPLQPIAYQELGSSKQLKGILAWWEQIFDKLIVLLIQDVLQVICPDRTCNLRITVVIHLAKTKDLLKGLARDDGRIDFYLNQPANTSYSPCPMNKILLMYSDASANRLGACNLSSPMTIVKVSSI